MGNEDLEKLIDKADLRELKDQRFWPKPPKENENRPGVCGAPFMVVCVVLSRCTTINSGACPDWDFCDPLCATK
jgi:hypothetical protein